MKQLAFQKTIVAGYLVLFLFGFFIASPGLVFAQEKSASDTNMEILREKLKADKKLLVAANMSLTDAEAKNFWPVYDGYQKELQTLNDSRRPFRTMPMVTTRIRSLIKPPRS
jgi:hypothetical protein